MNSKYIAEITHNLKDMYISELGLTKDYKRRIRDRINRKIGKDVISKLSRVVSLKDKKLLDVGCGWGGPLFEAYLKGAKCYGLEPNPERIMIAKLLFGYKKCTIKQGYGEKNPFKDNFFDIVVCNSVLEHVDNIEKTVVEMKRVTKKGGIIYLRVPNYMVPYERHYGIPWIPIKNRVINKLNLIIFGRKDRYVQHLNFVKAPYIYKILKKNNLRYRDIGMERMAKKYRLLSPLIRLLYFLRLNPKMELIVSKASGKSF